MMGKTPLCPMAYIIWANEGSMLILVRFCARLSYQNEKFFHDLVKTPLSASFMLHRCHDQAMLDICNKLFFDDLPP
jgi:hypothetical protein